MEEIEKLAIIRVLAKLTKSQYRELLAYRMFAQYLKLQGFSDADELIESARQSPELDRASADFDQAIDSKMPPFDEELQDEALRKWLANLPTNGLPN
jgi:hypothetical protein